MKEKLMSLWETAKAHKAEIIKVGSILVGAGIGVLVGTMVNHTEETFPFLDQDELDAIDESDEPDEEPLDD